MYINVGVLSVSPVSSVHKNTTAILDARTPRRNYMSVCLTLCARIK